MKNPNLIFALTVIFLLAIGIVYGQESATTGPNRATRLTNLMKSRLQLNDNQVAKVTELNQETANTLQEKRSQEFASQQEKVKAMHHVWRQHSLKLKSLLTDQQWGEFLAMRQEMHQRKQTNTNNRTRFRRSRNWLANGKPGSSDSTKTDLSDEDIEDLGGMDLFEGLDDDNE